MTDSNDPLANNPGGDASGAGQAGKPARKVAKTMLETNKIDLPMPGDAVDAGTTQNQAADNQSGAPRRKVAKTLLYPIGNLHRLGISQEMERLAREAAQSQEQAQSASPEPAVAPAVAAQSAPVAPTISPVSSAPAAPAVDAAGEKAASIAAQSITGSSKISPVMPGMASAKQSYDGATSGSYKSAAVDEAAALTSVQPPVDAPAPIISVPPKSERKVARTLLFKPVRTLDGDEAPSIESQVMAGQKIADQAQADALANPGAKKKPRDYVVAKTMLDHSVLFVMSSRNAALQETKALELAKEKANEPLKPQVEARKKALPCKWVWDEGDGYSKDRFRHCGVCKQWVYDFKNLDKDEAEALVFKREAIEKPVLYKRTDGKYMVNNCPVAVQHRKNMIMVGLVASLFVAGLITLRIMMPPPPPPPKQVETPQSKDPFAGLNARNRAKMHGSVGKDGVYHYKPGETTTTPDPTTVASPAGGSVGTPNTFTDPQQPNVQSDEQFWQYSGDTPSDPNATVINDNPRMPDPAGGAVQQYSQTNAVPPNAGR